MMCYNTVSLPSSSPLFPQNYNRNRTQDSNAYMNSNATNPPGATTTTAPNPASRAAATSDASMPAVNTDTKSTKRPPPRNRMTTATKKKVTFSANQPSVVAIPRSPDQVHHILHYTQDEIDDFRHTAFIDGVSGTTSEDTDTMTWALYTLGHIDDYKDEADDDNEMMF